MHIVTGYKSSSTYTKCNIETEQAINYMWDYCKLSLKYVTIRLKKENQLILGQP